LQLKIQSVDKPEKSTLVVLSGATDMKKMNQVCAYVTGHSPKFEYHSQRGTCIKGSRIELELDGAKLWLAAKSLGKQAVTQGAAHVEDKQVKIIQVFQGLNTSPTSGIVYDSNQARNVKAFWSAPNGERFEITAQAIVANKCTHSKGPMPRLVKHLDGYTPQARTGFGKGLYAANRDMQGDRQGPQYKLMFATKADVKRTHDNCQAKPIANDDGTIDEEGYMISVLWTPQNVATAGPPSPK
jgi:hypothetical protein